MKTKFRAFKVFLSWDLNTGKYKTPVKTRTPGKHLCQSLFFDKVAGLRPATLLKKRL